MKKLCYLLTLFAIALGFSAGAADLTSYAPQGTNVVVYANAKKISQSHVYRTLLQQSTEIKAALDEFDAEARKEVGITLPQLLNSEICLFVNARNFEEDPRFALIARFSEPVVKAVFNKMEQSGKKELITIQGKPAFKDQDFCLVGLTPTMATFSTDDGILTPGNNKLSAGIDTGALISATLDFSSVNIPADEENPLTKIAQHLSLLSFNFRETASGIRVELVSFFDDQEAAKNAEAFVRLTKNMIIEQAQKNPNAQNQAIADAISGIQVGQNQNKVIIYGDLTDDEFATLIQLMSN